MAAAVSSGAKIMSLNPLIHLNDNILMNTIALEESYKNKVKKFMFISSNTVYPLTDKSVVKMMRIMIFTKVIILLHG